MQRICLKNLLFLSLWATTVGCGAETLPGTDENQNDDGSNSEQTCTQIQDCHRGGEIRVVCVCQTLI